MSPRAALVTVPAVLRVAQALVDLLAHGADGELLGVPTGHPDLAASATTGSPDKALSRIFSLRT